MSLEKLWCFHIFEGDDGIIIADTKEEAEQKLKAEYPERFQESCESEFSIWNLVMDCSRSGDVIVTQSW